MPWQDYDKLAWYHDPEQDIAKFIHLALENMDDNNTHSLASQVQLSIAVAEFLFDNDVETNTRVIQSVPKGDFGDKAALFVHDGPFHKHLVQARVSGARLVAPVGSKYFYCPQTLKAFRAWALLWATEERSARSMKRPMRLQLWTTSRADGLDGARCHTVL